MSIEMWTLAIAVVTAVVCALPGALLLVKRDSMVSEGLSHAVLPGLVVGFMVVRSQGDASSSAVFGSPWLLVFAAACGVLMVWLSSWLGRTGLVDPDAGLGIVFAGMFSVGVLLASKYLRATHFHSDCIIEGNLALASIDRVKVAGYALGPRSWVTMLVMLVIIVGFLCLFYKELKLTLFDPTLASRFQLRPALLQFLMLALISLTTVTAFNIAGSILIVALMIAPPAAASLLTNRLSHLLWIAAGLAACSALCGFYVAKGLDVSPTAPIASAAGIVFLIVFLLAPERGLLASRIGRGRKRATTRQLLLLDILSREEEATAGQRLASLAWSERQIANSLKCLEASGFVQSANGTARVTEQGRVHLAQSLERMLIG